MTHGLSRTFQVVSPLLLLTLASPARPSHSKVPLNDNDGPMVSTSGDSGNESDQIFAEVVRIENLLRIEQSLAALRQSQLLRQRAPHDPGVFRIHVWSLFLERRYEDLLQQLSDTTASTDEFLYLRAAARVRLGLVQAALPDLRRLWILESAGSWGLAALWEIAQIDLPPSSGYSKRTRALIQKILPKPHIDYPLYENKRLDRMIDELIAGVSPNLRIELQVAKATRLLQREHAEQALAILQQLPASQLELVQRVKYLRIGQAHIDLGNRDKAVASLDRVLQHGSRDQVAAEAQSLIGQTLLFFRRYGEAKIRFERQLLDHPAGDQRRQALLGLGWVALRTGDHSNAERFFATAYEEQPYAEESAKALYWRARAAQAGSLAAADHYLARLQELFPTSAYTTWLTHAASEKRSAPAVTPDIAQLADFQKAEMLGPLQRRLVQLNDLQTYGPVDLDAIITAAEYVQNNELANAARRVRNRRFPDGLQGRDELLKVFPKSVAQVLRAEAEKQGVDSSLVIAVAKQESAFNPRAMSKAGALGLLQLLPSTARGLWREEGKKIALVPEDLFAPQLNARLGVRYLGRLVRAFSGQVAYALAAYNAGPGAVTRWRSLGELPEDIFMEEIPYAETRQYVQRVLGYRQAYRKLQQIENERSTSLAQNP